MSEISNVNFHLFCVVAAACVVIVAAAAVAAVFVV